MDGRGCARNGRQGMKGVTVEGRQKDGEDVPGKHCHTSRRT